MAEAVIPTMNNVALPVLLRVTVCDALVLPTAWGATNVTLAGERLAMGAVTPVPVSEIVCGLLEALSVKLTEPSALPAVVGVNVTLRVQIPPAATDALATGSTACAGPGTRFFNR